MHLDELWCNFPPEILSLNQIITIIYMSPPRRRWLRGSANCINGSKIFADFKEKKNL